MNSYSFFGHESFFCKSLWLKKGYDSVVQERVFFCNSNVQKMKGEIQ